MKIQLKTNMIQWFVFQSHRVKLKLMFEKFKQLFVVDFKRTHFVKVQIKF
jgi:hypothetical protein